MSDEHAYAYEAGYRDGSIHYELEHCPSCQNIADLQEALEENAKLRECVTRLVQANIVLDSDNTDLLCDMKDMQLFITENAKLREYAAKAWSLFIRHGAVHECDLREVDAVRDGLRELGIGVD